MGEHSKSTYFEDCLIISCQQATMASVVHQGLVHLWGCEERCGLTGGTRCGECVVGMDGKCGCKRVGLCFELLLSLWCDGYFMVFHCSTLLKRRHGRSLWSTFSSAMINSFCGTCPSRVYWFMTPQAASLERFGQDYIGTDRLRDKEDNVTVVLPERLQRSM